MGAGERAAAEEQAVAEERGRAEDAAEAQAEPAPAGRGGAGQAAAPGRAVAAVAAAPERAERPVGAARAARLVVLLERAEARVAPGWVARRVPPG